MNKQAFTSFLKEISLPEKGAYEAIFSLGCNCACAEYLRKYDLRMAAGPFDWILAPSAQAPFCVLLEDLRPLLKLDDLKEIASSSHNRVVVSSQSGYTLFHDFWQDTPLETQRPQVRAKYARRVKRFLDALGKGKRVLLVWYGETGLTLSDKEIVCFSDSIRAKYGQKVDLLVVQYEPDLPTALGRRLSGGIMKVAFPPQVRQEGNLLWDIQRLGPLFASIKCRSDRPSHWAGRLYDYTMRVLSVFIWNRKKRHHFIDVYINGK